MVTAATLVSFSFGAGVADGNIEGKVSQLYEGTRTITDERGGFESQAISCLNFLSGCTLQAFLEQVMEANNFFEPVSRFLAMHHWSEQRYRG